MEPGKETKPAAAVAATKEDPRLASLPSPVVREGDHMILVFADGKQLFAQAVRKWRGKTPPLKINKRSYSTYHLIGLKYGTILELGSKGPVALPEGEGLLPTFTISQSNGEMEGDEADNQESKSPEEKDNRNLVDSNTSQALSYEELKRMREQGTEGSVIVEKIIENSATFDQKTEFSKAKYVVRKQMKYQPRCRIVRCNAATICEAVFLRDPKKLMNMREDTLGQILSYANVCAGSQALILENCFGLVTGAVAERMAGYGRILSVYSGQQPAWNEMIQRFNLSFAESFSIKWVHSEYVFGENPVVDDNDPDKEERESLDWPCPLQDHTRNYVKGMDSDKSRQEFLAKRAGRFSRKLTRHSQPEANEWLTSRQSDALIIAAKWEPTETLLDMLRFLAPSCPFVVYSEFIEPLTECFLELQKQCLAINLRLSDTWTREYQVKPDRTHPKMDMSQSGGFLLTGIRLDPKTGKNELDESLLKEIRAQIGGRRGKKPNKPADSTTSTPSKNGKKRKQQPDATSTEDTPKVPRVETNGDSSHVGS